MAVRQILPQFENSTLGIRILLPLLLFFSIFSGVASDSVGIEPLRINPPGSAALAPLARPQAVAVQQGDDTLVVYPRLDGRSTYLTSVRLSEDLKRSEPIDLPRGDHSVHINPSLWVDSAGTVHCTWLSQISRRRDYQVWYSRLPPGSTDWSPVHVLGEGKLPNPPEIRGDAAGNLFIVYWNRTERRAGGHIFVMVSNDGGETWRASDPNFTDLDRGEASSPNLVVDQRGSLFLTWLDYTPGGRAVVFNRSSDQGRSWQEFPTALTQQPEFAFGQPRIWAGEGDLVVVLWTLQLIAPEGHKTEIWARISRDGGSQWEESRMVYSGYVIDVTAVPFRTRDRLGVLWIERTQEPQGQFKQTYFWEADHHLEKEATTVAVTRRFGYFEQLQVASDGRYLGAFVSEKSLNEGSLARVFVRNVETLGSDWHLLQWEPETQIKETSGPWGVWLGDSTLAVLFSETRRRMLPMEPPVWASDLFLTRRSWSFSEK